MYGIYLEFYPRKDSLFVTMPSIYSDFQQYVE